MADNALDFHVLRTLHSSQDAFPVFGTDALQEEGHNVGEPPRCSSCGTVVGMLPWLPPYRVEIEAWGARFGAVIIMSNGDLLVSEYFKDVYEKNNLRGLTGFDRVEIAKITRHRKMEEELPMYFKASVSHSRTSVDFAASGFEWKDPPTCSDCLHGHYKRWNGIVIDQSTWTGEDIFVPLGLSATIVTSERFKSVCLRNSITNISFTPARQYKFDLRPWEVISSSRSQEN